MEQREYWPRRLAAPVWVSVQEADDPDTVECIYDEAAQYEEDVRRAVQGFRSEEYPSSDLMSYFSLPEAPELETAIRKKVHAARLDVCTIGGRLYSAVDLELSDNLTQEEVAALTDQLKEQFDQGWGAEFEVIGIPVAENREIAVRFGNHDLEFLPLEAQETLAHMETEGNGWGLEQSL